MELAAGRRQACAAAGGHRMDYLLRDREHRRGAAPCAPHTNPARRTSGVNARRTTSWDVSVKTKKARPPSPATPGRWLNRPGQRGAAGAARAPTALTCSTGRPSTVSACAAARSSGPSTCAGSGTAASRPPSASSAASTRPRTASAAVRPLRPPTGLGLGLTTSSVQRWGDGGRAFGAGGQRRSGSLFQGAPP